MTATCSYPATPHVVLHPILAHVHYFVQPFTRFDGRRPRKLAAPPAHSMERGGI